MEDIAKQTITYKLVSWPTPQDYNEALQNPKLSFSDPELVSGKPALTTLGLPKPMTGAFASVYRMNCKDRDWAVRCFLRNFPDQHERYEKIEDHIVASKLPFTVGFDYIVDGLQVHGQRFPILKMEWAEGQQLDQFIDHNLHNPAVLRDTADRWKDMLRDLKASGIAHCDLQHGNILIDNKNFELVDYDGMYVPALAGHVSNELGHRNYQHPGRTKDHFGLYLDNFPGWLVYTCLICLSIDPALWKQLKGGDECLLFRQHDLTDPTHSRAFSILEHHQSSEIRKLARLLRSFLGFSIEAVPDLDANPADPVDLAELPEWSNLPDWIHTPQVSSPQPIFNQRQQATPPKYSKRLYSPLLNPSIQPSHSGSSSTGSASVWSAIANAIQRAGAFLGLRNTLLVVILGLILFGPISVAILLPIFNAIVPTLTLLFATWPAWLFPFLFFGAFAWIINSPWAEMGSTRGSHDATVTVLNVVLIILAATFIFRVAQSATTSTPSEAPSTQSEQRIKSAVQIEADAKSQAQQNWRIAESYLRTDQYDQARSFYWRILEICPEHYAQDPQYYHSLSYQSLNRIGESYQDQQIYSEAGKYLNAAQQVSSQRQAGSLTAATLRTMLDALRAP
jgi:serine/threonine protein kinase